jgi:hypothetical protein
MNRFGTSAPWLGLLLIAGGLLWLADATGVARFSPFVPATFFALAGILFAADYARDPRRWWEAIPAGALIGLGALIAFLHVTSARGEWGAAILLAGSGLGFAAAYSRNRDQWWALIPAGVLGLVAAIVASVAIVGGGQSVAVIVLGILGVALAALALVPVGGRRSPWLLLPAVVLWVVAGFISRGATDVLEPFNWVAPVALLFVGLVVLARTTSGRGAGRQGP